MSQSQATTEHSDRNPISCPVGRALALSVLVAALPACPTQSAPDEEADSELAAINRQDESTPEVQRLPDIFLIMVDTLRDDRVVCPADPSDSPLTPNICALLGKTSIRFQPAYAQSPWTRPSVACMLTGLYPHRHRATTRLSRLPHTGPHLAERLKGAGYRTVALVNNPNLHPAFGFDRGFDEYHYLGPEHDLFAGQSEPDPLTEVHRRRREAIRDYYRDAEEVTRAAVTWLSSHPPDRPLFLFITYMDPHDPYVHHPFDGTLYAKSDDPDPPPEVKVEYERTYDGEVVFLDFHLGRFLAALSSLGRFRDSVIMLISDHGEEFYEHEGWFHGDTLYEEVVRVPFFVKPPGHGRPELRPGPVESVDVAPTLLEAAGLVVPAEMNGRNVLARTLALRPVLFEDLTPGRNLRGVLKGSWKIILAEPEADQNPPRSLFRLDRDPNEQNDLSIHSAEELERLRTVLEYLSVQ